MHGSIIVFVCWTLWTLNLASCVVEDAVIGGDTAQTEGDAAQGRDSGPPPEPSISSDAPDEPGTPDPSADPDMPEATGASNEPTSTGEPSADGGCPEAVFLDVASSPGAGPGYPAPRLDVTCTADTLRVESNGIPHYTFVQITPNALVENDHVWEVPLHPELADRSTEVPLLGTAGFTVNGQPFFGPNEAAQPAAQAFGDPVYNGIMDECLGHTAFAYHYHALSVRCLNGSSLTSEPWLNPAPPADEPSPVLGFALDGFPIYGPMGCAGGDCSEVVEYLSGWEMVGNPTTNAWDNYEYVPKADFRYLDECNGHFGPAGDYHYHATAAFPYIIGCYMGTPADGGDGRP